MFLHSKHKLITLLTLLSLSPYLFAHSKKNNVAPYYFVADSVTYLSKAHRITYKGHVNVDQGATHITGDTLILNLNTANKIVKMIDCGHPATYTTKLPNKPGLIHAKADRITYDQYNQMVYLDGHAWVDQNHNTIAAAHIRYDKKYGVIHTRGSPHYKATHITVMPNKPTQIHSLSHPNQVK